MTQMTEFQKAMSPKGGAIAKRFNTAKLNDNLQWDVERDYALTLIEQDERLRECTPESVTRCLIDLGTMGLTLSPSMKLAYLIPYRDTKAGTTYCTLSVSYLGMEQIAYRTGFVEMIQTVVVRANDPTFRTWMDETGSRRIEHEEGRKDRGRVTHVYTVAHFSSGRFHVEVVDRDFLDACKEASARKNGGKTPFTWTGKFREEMYKKACLRRAFKHWPKMDNPALRKVIDSMDRTDPMEFNEKAPVEQSDTIQQHHIDELLKMMTEAGVPEKMQDQWLHAVATRFGYSKISVAKVDRFEAIASMMEAGISKWKSKQEDTTSPEVEK